MRAIGLHVRAPKERYLAAFAVVEDDRLVSQSLFEAPEAEDARSLHELYGRAYDLFGTEARGGRPLIGLWAKESAQGRYSPTLGAGRRAEGVLLAAAGARAARVVLFNAGSTIRAELALACGGKNDEIVAAARALLDGEPDREELAYAAAAALAAVRASEGAV